MLFADVSGKPAGSSTLATFDGGDVRSKCELIRNSTTDSAIQARTKAISPSTTRLTVGRRRRQRRRPPAPEPAPAPPPGGCAAPGSPLAPPSTRGRVR